MSKKYKNNFFFCSNKADDKSLKDFLKNIVQTTYCSQNLCDLKNKHAYYTDTFKKLYKSEMT